ncbi:hypothetical protein M2273_003558 [Mucilaginibacter lappiensis]
MLTHPAQAGCGFLSELTHILIILLMCKLTLTEFNKLSIHDQEEVIWNGTFLADREENGLIVRLYGLSAFYGEVFYDAHTNKVLKVRAFINTNNLVPYLAHIKFTLH